MNFIQLGIFSLLIFSLLSCNESSIDLGDGYKAQYDGNGYLVITNSNNSSFVYGEIELYKSDESYITVKQNPIDSICECNHKCFVQMESYNGKSYGMCKQAIENSSLRQYWIIRKYEKAIFDIETKTYSNVYGPYSEKMFKKEAQKLGITNNLILN